MTKIYMSLFRSDKAFKKMSKGYRNYYNVRCHNLSKVNDNNKFTKITQIITHY